MTAAFCGSPCHAAPSAVSWRLIGRQDAAYYHQSTLRSLWWHTAASFLSLLFDDKWFLSSDQKAGPRCPAHKPAHPIRGKTQLSILRVYFHLKTKCDTYILRNNMTVWQPTTRSLPDVSAQPWWVGVSVLLCLFVCVGGINADTSPQCIDPSSLIATCTLSSCLIMPCVCRGWRVWV